MFRKITAGMLGVTIAAVSCVFPAASTDVYGAVSIEDEIAQEEKETEEQLRKESEAETYGDSFSVNIEDAGAVMAAYGFMENGKANIPEGFSSGEIEFYQAEEVFGDGPAELFTDSEEKPSEPEIPNQPMEAVLDAADGEDITGKLNSLLLEMSELAADDKPCKVIIPPGNYRITGTICTYSNIHIYAVGAVITKTSPAKEVMLRLGNTEESMGGYEGYRNVTIEGGTWDANYDSVPDKEADGGFVDFRIGHATNVLIKNVTFLNNLKSHFLEFGGVKNARVTGCTFRGYWEPFDGGGQECIQIDACRERIFPGYLPYDGSVCENIYIEGNTFENVFAGVGSHSMVFDRPYKNIVIRGNTFRNLRKRAVWCLNYKDSVVENNVMTNVGGGVYVRSVYSRNTYLAEDSNATDKGNQQPQNLKVINNKISLNAPEMIDGSLWRSYGIYLVGEKCTDNESGVPDGTYIIRGVDVRKNKISGPGNGIRLTLADACSVADNDISMSRTKQFANVGISLSASCSDKVTGNKIRGAKSAGIYVYRGSDEYKRPGTGNVFSGNSISACGGDGIAVNRSCDNAKVEKNRISSISGDGISIWNNSGASVEGNTVNGCRRNGIFLSAGNKAAVAGNQTSRSAEAGIFIQGSDNVTLSENIVYSNKTEGISFEKAKNLSLIKNTIKYNRGYGIKGKYSSVKKMNSNLLWKNGHKNAVYTKSTTLPRVKRQGIK